jgi:PEP-CTERM motif
MKMKKALLMSALLLGGMASGHAATLTYTGGERSTATPIPTNLLTADGSLTAQSGTFGSEGTGPLSVLTDGLGVPAGPTTDVAHAVDAISNSATLTYTLDTGTNTAGYTINAIDLISAWSNNGRSNIENVTVSYELVGSGSFTQLLDGSTVVLQPSFDGAGSNGTNYDWEDVNYANGSTPLITGVKAVKFTFGAQQNGYAGYQELDIEGIATSLPVPEPATYALLGLGALALLFINRRSASKA